MSNFNGNLANLIWTPKINLLFRVNISVFEKFSMITTIFRKTFVSGLKYIFVLKLKKNINKYWQSKLLYIFLLSFLFRKCWKVCEPCLSNCEGRWLECLSTYPSISTPSIYLSVGFYPPIPSSGWRAIYLSDSIHLSTSCFISTCLSPSQSHSLLYSTFQDLQTDGYTIMSRERETWVKYENIWFSWHNLWCEYLKIIMCIYCEL